MLKVGDSAPDFDLPDAAMEMVSLVDFRGKKSVVLYFYPKDDTPGCTLQAIEFGDLEEQFERYDSVVFGISRDDCISHAAFRDKHGLSVQLLADEESEVCRSYDVLQERVKDGVKKMCLVRSTVLIDRKGVVRHIMRDVVPKGHALEVLKLVKEMNR